MRIAHLCLAAFYIDGFGYQENILPRIHKSMGHEVCIIASTETYIDRQKLGYVEASSYTNEDGIPVHRLPYARWVPRKIQPKIRAYRSLWDKLDAFKPDLIFLHDVQFWDILIVRRYALANGIPIHADSHTDFVNSARGFVSHRLLHGMLYRWLVQRADAAVHRYFPTLPARADFLHGVYGISRDKMELLPFGFDDTAVVGQDRAKVRKQVRARLGIAEEETVFVTGGKLDLRKNIHVLVQRFVALRQNGELPDTHLVVFGDPTAEVKAALESVDTCPELHMIGWVPADKIHRWLWAADLAIFPGTHSVLWEQAIGHGLGAVFHHWPAMEHLDLGGNARFIYDAKPDTLDALLLDLTRNDGATIGSLNRVAAEKGPEVFAFSKIAERALRACGSAR